MIQLDTWVNHDCTIGRLRCDESDFQCFTLELPWRHNETNRSCISAGVYPVSKMYSPNAKREVLRLRNVPMRTVVNVEAGNYTHQLLGCILVGDAILWLDKDKVPDVSNSNKTLDALLALLPDNTLIDIKRCGFYY